MAHIEMLKTTKVSTTGLNCLTWEEGKTYDAPVGLAKNLVDAKLAKKGKAPVKPAAKSNEN